MRELVEVDLKWYHFRQNNSGGYFIHNDVVGEDLFVQAASEKEARRKAEDIVEGYSAYCDCCGERWSTDYPDAGSDVPSRYGRYPLSDGYKPYEKDGYAVLHYYSGKVEKFYPHSKEAFNFDSGEVDTRITFQ